MSMMLIKTKNRMKYRCCSVPTQPELDASGFPYWTCSKCNYIIGSDAAMYVYSLAKTGLDVDYSTLAHDVLLEV